MKLAKVIGTIVSTVKDPSLRGLRILLVQPQPESQDGPIAAIDMTQAGIGELVWCTFGREASLALPEPFAPVDAVIVGIADQVNL